MENQQDTHTPRSNTTGYLLSGGLLLAGLLTTGTQQLALLATSAIVFGFSHRVNGTRLLPYLVDRARNTLSPLKRRALLALLDLTIPKFNRLTHRFQTIQDELEREQEAQRLVDEFVETAERHLDMAVPTIDTDKRNDIASTVTEEHDGELSPATTYRTITESIYPNTPQDELEARLITILTYHVDHVTNSTERYKLVTQIDQLISGCTFYPLGDAADKILTCYESFRLENHTESTPRDIFEYDRTRSDRELTDEFLRNYSDEQRFKHVLKNNRQIEELRSTLADLVRTGKLDIGNIHEDVIREKLKEVKEELNEQESQYSSYLLISSKLINETDPHGAKAILESKYPTIKLGTWEVKRNTEFEDVYLSTRLIYTTRDYPDTDTFLNEEIKPLLPPKEELDEGAFVAAMPFEAPDYKAHPTKEEVIEHTESDWWESTTEKNFEYIESLQIGSTGLAAEIATENITREVSVDELLRVIPFNVVAPQLNREQKRVIRDNYKPLKNTFNVETLFDWADVNPEDLAEELHAIEPDIDYDDWETTADNIIDGIEECTNATRIQPNPATA